MPGNLLTADITFPQLSKYNSTEEKVEALSSYLFMLLEQLRYTMGNLGLENMNANGLTDLAAEIIEKPVMVNVEGENGEKLSISAMASGLMSQVSNTNGEVSKLIQQVDGISAEVSDATGAVSRLTQTVKGISLNVKGSGGNAYLQLVNAAADDGGSLVALQLGVSNGEKSSTISLLADGIQMSSQIIKFTGSVLFASDLGANGTTVIDGGRISSGTIQGVNLVSESTGVYANSRYYFQRVTISAGETRYSQIYRTTSTQYDNSGTEQQYGAIYADYSNQKFFIKSGSQVGTSKITIPLKVVSASNMSIDATPIVQSSGSYGADTSGGSGKGQIYFGGALTSGSDGKVYGQRVLIGGTGLRGVVAIYPGDSNYRANLVSDHPGSWMFFSDGIYYNGTKIVSV